MGNKKKQKKELMGEKQEYSGIIEKWMRRKTWRIEQEEQQESLKREEIRQKESQREKKRNQRTD